MKFPSLVTCAVLAGWLSACSGSQPPSGTSAATQTSAPAPDHAHHHHNHAGGVGSVKVEDGVRAEFDVMAISAHLAMAEEMGIRWTPDPTKNFHLSVTLATAPGGQTLRDLPVRLAVTDPTGAITDKQAEVMSAAGMYHYGIDFQRDSPGLYHAVATFEMDGRTHSLAADIQVQ